MIRFRKRSCQIHQVFRKVLGVEISKSMAWIFVRERAVDRSFFSLEVITNFARKMRAFVMNASGPFESIEKQGYKD